mmetsp:Transcript_24345/g.62777  ORF Transcript_24345/g.62777 Transcript_24345/m.62777 type:complete len:351 (+) Transcript_24345:308-1360(+)
MAGGSECATAPSRSTSSASSVARARSSRSAATRAGSAAPATSASSASSGCRFPASIAAPNAASSAALSGATRATRALSRASGGQKRSGMPPRARERSSHTCSAPSTSVHVMRTPGPAHQRPPPACWLGSGSGWAAALSSSSSTHARASTAWCSAAPSGSAGSTAALGVGAVAPRVDSAALAALRPLPVCSLEVESAESAESTSAPRVGGGTWPRSAHSRAATRSHLARSAANSGSSSAVPFGCPGGGRGARVATGGMQLQSLRSALGSASNALPTKCQLCTSASRSARNTSRAPDATESDASASNAHAGPRNAPHATQRTSATGAIASSATRPISQNTHNHTGSCCSSST